MNFLVIMLSSQGFFTANFLNLITIHTFYAGHVQNSNGFKKDPAEIMPRSLAIAISIFEVLMGFDNILQNMPLQQPLL